LSSNFTAPGNTDRIELEIDPNNDLIELDDQFRVGSLPNANKVRAPLSVENEERNISGLVIPIILFILLGAILIGMGIFFYTRMNRIYLFPVSNEK